LADRRFIVIKAVYERQIQYGRSLEWIAPELHDAGLSLIEDHADEPSPSRTWAGILDAPTFRRFADAWHLHDQVDEPVVAEADGHPAAHTYTLDGMNWEDRGESPIVYVTVDVRITPDQRERRAHHRPLPFTSFG
jgi:hypothetical protein